MPKRYTLVLGKDYETCDRAFLFFFPDMLQRLRSSPPLLSGPDLARLMHVGTRVVRGADWKWGDQVIMKFGFLVNFPRAKSFPSSN